MEDILNLLQKIDEITSKINATLSETDIPLSDQLSEVEDILSSLIGSDAFRMINDYTEQFRNLIRMVQNARQEFRQLEGINPAFERNFKAVDDVLGAIENKTKSLKNQQLIVGDLSVLQNLQDLFSKDFKFNLDIPIDKFRELKEKYGKLEFDVLISEVRRDKVESFNRYNDQILSSTSQFLSRPLNIDQNTFAYEGFKELDTQSRRLASAFSYFQQQLDLAQNASTKTTDSLSSAVRNLELAANRQLQFANQQFARGEIDRETFDLISQSIQEGITRINAELPKELRIKLLDDDILKSDKLIDIDTIARATSQGRANEPQLNPLSYLDIIRNTSRDLQSTFESKLSAFTTYKEQLTVSGAANDPLSMMMFIGMGYQQELNPAIQRFTDKIKEFESKINSNPIFQSRARDDAEVLLNQKLLEAYQLRETRISEGRKLYETGQISEERYNSIVKEAETEFRKLIGTLKEAQLSFNAIANSRTGINPINLLSDDIVKQKLASGQTTVSLDEIRNATRTTSGFERGIQRLEAELYQGAIAIRDMFAKITGNLLMNSAWTVAFTIPMALMNNLIFEPYTRTRNILEPAFTGIGQATGVPQAVSQISNFVGGGFINSANDIFDKLTSLTAIYRSPQISQQVVSTALQEARYQPIQFSDATELLRSFAVFPGTRNAIGTSEESRRQLLDVAQYLQMLSPEQGVQGAIIALREFFSGDFRSLKMRFEIDPESLAAMANTTTGQMLSASPDKKIEYLYTALSNLLGKESLFYKGANVEFQIQNLTDVLQQTIAASFATTPVPSLTAYYSSPQGEIIKRNMEEELRTRGYDEDEIQKIVEIRLRLRQTLNGAIAGIVEDFNNVFSKYLTNANVAGSASNFLSKFILQIQQSITEFDQNVEVGRPDAFRIFVKQISQSLTNLITALESEFENNEDLKVITESIGNVVSKMVQKIFVSTMQILGQTIAGSLVELPSTFYSLLQGVIKASLKVPGKFEDIINANPESNNVSKYLLTVQNGQIAYQQSDNEINSNDVKQGLQDFNESMKTISENLRQFNNILTLVGTVLTPGGMVGKSAAFVGLSTVSGMSQNTGFQDIIEAGITSYIGYQLARAVSRNISNLSEGFSKLGLVAGATGIAGIEYLKYQQGQSLTSTVGNLLMEGSLLALVSNFDKFRDNIGRTIGNTTREYRFARFGGASIGSAIRAGLEAALTGLLASPIKHPLLIAGAFLAGAGLTYYSDKKEEEEIKKQLEKVRQTIIKSIDSMLTSMSQQAESLATTDTQTFYAKIKDSYGNKIQEISSLNASRQIPVIVAEQLQGLGTEATIKNLFGGLEKDIKPETIFQTFQLITESISNYTNQLVRLLENAARDELDQTGLEKGIEQLQKGLVDVRNRIYQQLILQNPNISEGQANETANRMLAFMIENINETARKTIERNVKYLNSLNELYKNPDVVEKLFTNSNTKLELPQLQLDLTGNVDQQIKAFVQKVEETFSKGIDAYIQSLDITEETFTFGDKLQEELRNLDEKINSTLDSLFGRITSVGRKLGFLTPEQEYESLKMRETLAQRTARTNPEQAIRMLLGLSEDYNRLGDMGSAFRTWNLAKQLVTQVPDDITRDFRRRYLLDAPPEVREIPNEYLKIAQNIAPFDKDLALKYANQGLKVAEKYGDTEKFGEIANFMQGILQPRANVVNQLLEKGGLMNYVRGEILRETSSENVQNKARTQLSSLDEISEKLKQNLGLIGNYNFPQLRKAVVDLDNALANNVSSIGKSNGSYGKAIDPNHPAHSIHGTTTYSSYGKAIRPADQIQTENNNLSSIQLSNLINTHSKFKESDLSSLYKYVQPPKTSDIQNTNLMNNQFTNLTNEMKKITDEVMKKSNDIKSDNQLSKSNIQLPNLQNELNKISDFSNQIAQQFANMTPEYLWKPSTSDKSIGLTQKFFGDKFGITPTTMPILDSIDFFGIQSSNVLPNIDIPRDIYVDLKDKNSIQKLMPDMSNILSGIEMPKNMFNLDNDISMQKLIPDMNNMFNLSQSGLAKQIISEQNASIVNINASSVYIQT